MPIQKAATRPGSIFNRQGGSIFNRRRHLGISRTIGNFVVESDLSYIPLFNDPLFAALPLQHSLAARKSLKAVDFNDIPFISYPKDPNSSFSKRALGLLEAAGAKPRIGYEAKEIHTALGLVAAGLGATLVGKTVAINNRTDVRFMPIKDIKTDAKVFAVRKKDEPNSLADAFLKIIQVQSELV